MFWLVLSAVLAGSDVDGGAAAGSAEPPPSSATTGVADGGSVAAAPAPEAEISKRRAVIDSSDGLSFRFRLGFSPEWGSQPGASLGAGLGFRLGSGAWSGILEAWNIFPSAFGPIGETRGGSVSSFSVGGILGGCYERPVLSGSLIGCVLARGGAMLFEPRNLPDVTASQWQPVVSAGLRVSGEWPRESLLAFFVASQVFVPILRPHFDSVQVRWAQSWVFGGLQVGLRLRLQ